MNEDDLWRAFWGDDHPKNAADRPGQKALVLREFLDALGSAKLIRSDRYFYICCLDHHTEIEAVIPQARIIDAGRALLSNFVAKYRHDLAIQYIGTSPEMPAARRQGDA